MERVNHDIYASGTLDVFQGAAGYPSVMRDIQADWYCNPLIDTMEHGFYDTG